MSSPLALVTGGNRGIGLAIAQELRALGYALALVARDRERLAAAAQSLAAADTLAVDLAANGAAARVVDWLGDRAVDILVNNAGVAPSDRIEATSDDVLRTVLSLHVEVPFALIRALLPGMKARGRGTIVQMGSTAGLRAIPFTAAYSAAKHGMSGLSRALIAELGPSPIRVYAVCPGFVDTDLTRKAAANVAARGKQTAAEALDKMGKLNALGRMHTAAEIAAFVRCLLAERPASGLYDLDCEVPTRVD